MQPISAELEAILKSFFQAAADGFAARLDVSTYVPPTPPAAPSVVQIAYAGTWNATFATPVTVGNTVIAVVGQRSPTGVVGDSGGVFTTDAASYGGLTGGSDVRGIVIGHWLVNAPQSSFDVNPRDTQVFFLEVVGEWVPEGFPATQTGVTSATVDCGGSVTPSGVPAIIVGGQVYGPKSYIGYPSVTADADSTEIMDAGNGPHSWGGYRVIEAPSGSYSVGGTLPGAYKFNGATVIYVEVGSSGGGTPASSFWTPYQIESVSIDKSLRSDADQAEVVLANEALPLGWGPDSIFTTNQRIRIYQWFGDAANAVLTFTGLIDKVRDHRDVLGVTVSCRDLMALLIDQTFSATAPQLADEAGNVRTATNGVYLNMEISDIVYDIVVNRVGWPVDDVDITDTSYVLDEFIIPDGASYASAIIGEEQLTGLVGYSAWADELGVFHFGPTLISSNFTDPPDPSYTYRSGEDVVSLDDEIDQYELFTRVKVRGPLTTETLTDTWRELWRTKKFHLPVGLWHDPADAANLRVLDRGTKRMYKLRQSDRAILSSVNIQPIVAHPLGLSGDPADSAVYWILNAPWIDGVSGTNKVKKVRKSDNHVLASFDLPAGNWSALKVSSSFLWLTNLSTDRFYKRSKSDGSAIANYQHTYNGNVQANPSGLMIDGTTLFLFWANGGSTARFLVCDESAPATITDVVKTAGTTLHGGEMDTVTHTECYGDSDSLGLVAKFTLVAKTSQTSEVFEEIADSDLEDSLGELALMGNREHDQHPSDDDHPFEIRRLTLDLEVITSLAQAMETATRQLELASVRRRVLDVGIVPNPGLQKTDLIAVVDPVTGISSSFAVDTLRTDMNSGTYLGVAAVLPVEEFDDDPDDEGDATEDA